MKKKRLIKKLNLNKTVISKFQTTNLKGGGSRGCAGGGGGSASTCYPTIDGCDPWTGSATCPGN